MWLFVSKVALLAFIAIGLLIIVATYIRRRRSGITGWHPPNSSQYLEALGGRGPQFPAPDWVYWDDEDDDQPPRQ